MNPRSIMAASISAPVPEFFLMASSWWSSVNERVRTVDILFVRTGVSASSGSTSVSDPSSISSSLSSLPNSGADFARDRNPFDGSDFQRTALFVRGRFSLSLRCTLARAHAHSRDLTGLICAVGSAKVRNFPVDGEDCGSGGLEGI